MINELILLSGADIPFIEGTITIHQPTLFEIAMIGEQNFFIGCEMLRFSKDSLILEDKDNLNNYSDFNILMSIINDKSGSMANNVSCAKQVLDLILPQYKVIIMPTNILCLDWKDEVTVCGEINDNNFNIFKSIITNMFCLKKASSTDNYNVQSELAKKIADKFKNRSKQLAKLTPDINKVAIFSKYISILTVGEHKDMNSFMRYTVYQLFDEFQRYQLKVAFDMHIQARLAGAKDLKEPDDWMKDIHE